MAKSGMKARLGANFKDPRTRMLLLLGTAMALVMGGVVAYNIMSTKPTVAGRVEALPSVDSTPGGSQSQNPHYQKVQQQADQKRFDDAQNKGGAVVPTYGSGAVVDSLDKLPLPEKKRDVMPEEKHETRSSDYGGRAAQQQPVQQQSNEQVSQLAALKAAQAGELMKSWMPNHAIVIAVAQNNGNGAGQQTAGPNNNSSSIAANGPVLVKMGTFAMAQNRLAINSDRLAAGAAAMVTIADGVLKGADLFGQVTNADDRLVIKLTKMSFKNIDYTINAVVIDPNTNEQAIADKSDPRYIERFGILAATEFISGVGKIMSQTGQTQAVTQTGQVTTQQQQPDLVKQGLYGGAANMAGKMSSVVEGLAPKGPKNELFVNSGVGVLFMDTVREKTSNSL